MISESVVEERGNRGRERERGVRGEGERMEKNRPLSSAWVVFYV